MGNIVIDCNSRKYKRDKQGRTIKKATLEEIELNIKAFEKGEPLKNSLKYLGPRFKEEIEKRFGKFQFKDIFKSR